MLALDLEEASSDPDAPQPSILGLLLFLLGGFSPTIAGVAMAWRVGGGDGREHQQSLGLADIALTRAFSGAGGI